MTQPNPSATLRIRLLSKPSMNTQIDRLMQVGQMLADAGYKPVEVQVEPLGLGDFFAERLRQQADPAVMQVL